MSAFNSAHIIQFTFNPAEIKFVATKVYENLLIGEKLRIATRSQRMSS